MEIEAILQQLEDQLMLINSPLLKLLNSGISKDLVDHQLTSFDFAISAKGVHQCMNLDAALFPGPI